MNENAAAQTFAAKLRMNAIGAIALTGAVFLGLPFIVDFQKPLSVLLWLGMAAAAASVIALSLYLLFDAMLFRLLASYENEDSGGIAIDRFLSRTGLRKLPETNRALAERMAGTARLLSFQRAALLVFLALFVSMAAV
jgi:hypothetical protein